MGLLFSPQSKPVRGYVNADWGDSTVDRKSHSGYIFILGGSPISWNFRKQRTVALSITEAEYMALAECTKEAIYLQRFICELGFNKLANLKVFCDRVRGYLLKTYVSRKIEAYRHPTPLHSRRRMRENIRIGAHINRRASSRLPDKRATKAKHQWCMKT